MNDTLARAQKKALEISLSVAKLQKLSDIIDGLDERLEILTGSKVFVDSPLLKPPPLPEPTAQIIALLRKNRDGLTLHTIGKQTKLDKATTQTALDTLVEQGVIFSPKSKGWKKYALQ